MNRAQLHLKIAVAGGDGRVQVDEHDIAYSNFIVSGAAYPGAVFVASTVLEIQLGAIGVALGAQDDLNHSPAAGGYKGLC